MQPEIRNPNNQIEMNYMPRTMDDFEAPQVVYPEVYYKLQPYIMLVCDQMDTYGDMMPTRDMAEQITDQIYDDCCRMYPELENYIGQDGNMKTGGNPVEVFNGFGNPRFRRRGLGRDLIDILLLTELFRRRRRPYYPLYF